MGKANFRPLTDGEFDRRMQDWAIWCQNGQRGAYLGYRSPLDSMAARSGVRGSVVMTGTVMADDQEQEVERFVMCLAAQDLMAAEVVRAEYKAHPRYGQAGGPFTGVETRERSCKQLKISLRTYEAKLQLGRAVIRSLLMATMLKPAGAAARAASL